MVHTVTPEQASAWIRHSHQRNIDLYKCRAMLTDLEAGEWDVSRQQENPVIVLNDRGSIGNGHHRMLTVLMWGKPVECEVIWRG